MKILIWVKDKFGYYKYVCPICGEGNWDTNKKWITQQFLKHRKESPDCFLV